MTTTSGVFLLRSMPTSLSQERPEPLPQPHADRLRLKLPEDVEWRWISLHRLPDGQNRSCYALLPVRGGR
jgi:hypothetical protein